MKKRGQNRCGNPDMVSHGVNYKAIDMAIHVVVHRVISMREQCDQG
jgi:hypothetical protein